MREFFKHFWLNPLQLALTVMSVLIVAAYADPGKHLAAEIHKCRAENLH